jgi:septum formation protein
VSSSPELILASTSPYRRALLERLGLTFRCEAPGVDEEAAKQRFRDPVALAQHLASEKTAAVAKRFPNAIVVGSDQLATIDGEVIGKSGTAENAVAQLERLAGRTHELITAVCVMRLADGMKREYTDIAKLTMRPLDRAALTRYVAIDSPTDCAGSYKIEAAGVSLFAKIETNDFTAITGLPLIALVEMLSAFGVAVP